jgi:uncharacterized protein YlzI (FlbEa/FlbD family)
MFSHVQLEEERQNIVCSYIKLIKSLDLNADTTNNLHSGNKILVTESGEFVW